MFRFTIRELVLLTLVMAMGLGWWLDRHTLKNEAWAMEVAAHLVARNWAREVGHVVEYKLVDDREWRAPPASLLLPQKSPQVQGTPSARMQP